MKLFIVFSVFAFFMEAFAGKSFNDALDEKLKYVDSLSAEQADALHRDNLLIDAQRTPWSGFKTNNIPS